MSKIQIYLLLSAITTVMSGCSGNGDNADPMTQKLDSIFDARYADCANSPGGAVLIAQGDSIIYERYYGLANMETGERVDENTLFNLASVSKQFTVAALLQQPGLDIDDSVDKYFDFPQDFWHFILLSDLAGHTSGLPDSRDRSDREKCLYATDESSEAYFPEIDSLIFTPGTEYDYVNPTFILLARVVEKLSGEEFTEYQQRHIFGPLGMNHTVYFSPGKMPEHTAHAYAPDGKGGWKKFDYGEETFFGTRPDGGLYSTARDMLKWERGLAEGKVLSDSMLLMAYSPRISVADSKICDYQRRPYTWYGLGWFIDETPGIPVKIYHPGDNGGFQAYVAKYPLMDMSVIVLENRHDKDRWSLAQQLDSILPPPPPPAP